MLTPTRQANAAPAASRNNPITGAILTPRGTAHYTTTQIGDEAWTRTLNALCNGRNLRHAQRTAVGAVTCAKCARLAKRNRWVMDGPTSTASLIAGSKVEITFGFAKYQVVDIVSIGTHMMRDQHDDELSYHVGDHVTVVLPGYGLRHLSANIFRAL